MSFITKTYIDQRTTLKTQPLTLDPLAGQGFDATLAAINEATGFGPKTITFDAVVNETHEHRNLITENPIEDGSVVVDHKTKMPFTLNISGLLTDTPIAKNIPFFAALNSEEGRARKLMNEIVGVDAENVLFTIVTGIKAYKNLLFEELTPQRGGDDSGIRFQAKCRQVQIVTKAGEFFSNVATDIQHTAFGIVSAGVVVPV